MPRSATLDHPALLYEGVDGFVEGVGRHVREGIELGETAFVAARPDYLDVVRDELGEDAAEVRWEDATSWHPHHASRLRALYELIAGAPEGTRFRLVAEPVWPERREDVREWQRYESVLNAVLAPFPVSLLCLYDASTLDPSVLEIAGRTHPMVGPAAMHPGPYEQPEAFLRRRSAKTSRPPPGAEVAESVEDLAAVRGLVLDRAMRAGVDPEDAAALSIATNEVLTNALIHGGGEARLTLWARDGRFVCQVEDEGRGISDPLAGYRPPGRTSGGRGLWLARQLVELMEILPAERGTTIRLYATLG